MDEFCPIPDIKQQQKTCIKSLITLASFETESGSDSDKNFEILEDEKIKKVQKSTYKPFSFTIKVLESNDENANSSVKLQDKILDNLKANNNEGFITIKTAENFKNLSNLKNGITVGIFDDKTGQLIGQSSVSFENLNGKECESFVDTDKISYNPSNLMCDNIKNIFEVKGTMINPDYGGMGLAQAMALYLEKAVLKIYSHNTMLVAEVAKDNEVNLHVCEKTGFKALQKYVAFDGVECYLLYKPIGVNLEHNINFEKTNSILPKQEKVNSI